ncbi:MAG TPA: hypothetical protein VHQ86_01395 [Candidatus Saccharimonadia bacterium]|jgi:hypothetical protein|nr:hypothetical protein [Candidatus Saccharimonadia bacterium]
MTNPTKIASGLLITGVVCVAVSFGIAALFLNGTNFKAQYRAHQYQQCIDRHTPVAECQQSFGER